jgi:nucleotide-binding universal stress UspA family protein
MRPKNVLLATDLDRRTDRAMDRAAALATEWGSRLVIAHAIEGTPGGWPRTRPKDLRAAAIRRIREDLREPVPTDLELVVERGDAVKVVLETIARFRCALVVTGVARASGFTRASAGATVDALARLSPVPVLAVKTRPNRPYREVVVATDFSESSREALLLALEMFPSAHISLFHAYHVAYEALVDDKCAARESEARLADDKAREFLAATALGDRNVEVRSEHGPPELALCELAVNGGVDLIVVGTRGRGVVGQLLLGSVARSIVAEVPADVLIAPSRTNGG